MAPRNRHLSAFLAAAALAGASITACGDGDEGDSSTTIPGGADPEVATVIDEWAERLAEGDVDGAAQYFAIPSIAVNGAAFEIESEADARLFNESLPCGAELVEASTVGELTLATFTLTERPGPGTCGEGVGGTALTKFRVEDGLITEWRRAVGEESGVEDPEAPSNPI